MEEFRIEHNVKTGEILEIPLTDKEIKELQNLRVIAIEQQNKEIEEKTKAEADKAALLARLGLTSEEAALLLS
jgi:hypothetical protein